MVRRQRLVPEAKEGWAGPRFELEQADAKGIELLKWLWADRLGRGIVNNLQGDPGDGKSVISIDIAARVSTGADFPDGAKCTAGNVIILSGEDSLKNTINARLKAAGAEHSAVNVWAVDRKHRESAPCFPRDIEQLRRLIEADQVALVIIDPLENFLDDDLDPNSNPSIRKVLSSLAWLAHSTDTCVLIIRHLSKDPKIVKAKYRGSGSIAITGAARSNWHAGRIRRTPHPKFSLR